MSRERDQHLTPLSYIDQRIRNINPTYANCQSYVFTCVSYIEQQQINRNIYSVWSSQKTSGMREDLLVMRNVLVQEDTSSSPPSRSRSGRRTLSTSLATDQDYSYSEVHQASFSHHLSFLCFNFYIIMLSGPTVCDCPRTSRSME